MTGPAEKTTARSAARDALVHLGIAALATWPMVLDPTRRLLGHPDVDSWNHAWGPWWFAETLSRGELPWHTTLLASPRGGTLWYIDPIGAVLGAPLVPILGAIGAYNLTVLLQSAVTSVGGRRLARALGAGPEASWIGAVGAACSAYALCEIHNGVSEAAGIGWALLALAAGARALRGGRWRDYAATGAWLGLTAIGTWYYGLGVGVTLVGWTIGIALLQAAAWLRAHKGARTLAPDAENAPAPTSTDAVPTVEAVPVTEGTPAAGAPERYLRSRARVWFGMGLAAMIAAGVSTPALLAARTSLTASDSIVHRGELRPEDRDLLLSHNALDPRAYLLPRFHSVDLAARGEAFRHASYMGVVALGLAFAAGRQRLWLLGVLPAAALSLGPWLWWGGDWVAAGPGMRYALPFAWVQGFLPGAAATHAQRVGMPVVLVGIAVAAVGADGLARRWASRAPRLPVLALFGALLVADHLGEAPWPLARSPVVDLGLHAELGARPAVPPDPREPERGTPDAILDLPTEVGATMATSRYLVYQTASGLPIPYRPDARAGTSSLLNVPAFVALALPGIAREEHLTPLRKILALQSTLDVDSLRVRGRIRWIVVHRELERGSQGTAETERLLAAWYGPPIEVRGTHAVWDTATLKHPRVARP